MKPNKLLDIIGILMLAIGFFLAFLPHAVHSAVGLNNSSSNLKHALTGISFVIIALGILIYNNKALKPKFYFLQQ